MRPPDGGHETTALKKSEVVFVVQGLAPTYRKPLTTGEWAAGGAPKEE